MNPIIGGAIISGVSSLFGGLFGNKSTTDTNRLNLQIAREQNAFNERMWQKNNEYNTPSAQMARYAAAGINPYFALGNVNGGNATAQTAAQVAPMQPQDYSYMHQIGNNAMTAAMNYKQGQMMDEQLKAAQMDNKYREQNILNNIAKTLEETAGFREKNKGLKMLNYMQQETMAEQIEMKRQERAQAELETVRKTIENNNMTLSGELMQKNINMSEKQMQLLDAQYKQALATTYSTYQSAYNNTRMTDQQIEESASRVAMNVTQESQSRDLHGLVKKKAERDIRIMNQQINSNAPTEYKAKLFMQDPNDKWIKYGNTFDTFNPFKEFNPIGGGDYSRTINFNRK